MWTSQVTGRSDYGSRDAAVQATRSALRGRFPAGARAPSPQAEEDGTVRFYAPHHFPTWAGQYVGCVFETPADN